MECDSAKDAEKIVQNGKANCFLVESGQLPKYSENNKFHSVYLTQTGNSSFAIKRENTELMSIMNKTLKTMSSSLLNGALSTYDSSLEKVTVKDFVKENILFSVFFHIFRAIRQKNVAADRSNSTKQLKIFISVQETVQVFFVVFAQI